MDDFFSFGSKAVIVIPIMIVILSLIFKFNQPSSKAVLSSNSSLIPSISPAITSEIKFDFKGPYKCNYKDEKIEAVVYIKNKKVLAEVKNGKEIKKYLLTPYVPIAESMLTSNISGIENMASQYMKRKISIKDFLSSCKKEDFDEKIFR